METFNFPEVLVLLQNHPFQAFLGSKTHTFIYEEEKITLLLIFLLRHRGGGGGLRALAYRSAKNVSFFLRFPLPFVETSGEPKTDNYPCSPASGPKADFLPTFFLLLLLILPPSSRDQCGLMSTGR